MPKGRSVDCASSTSSSSPSSSDSTFAASSSPEDESSEEERVSTRSSSKRVAVAKTKRKPIVLSPRKSKKTACASNNVNTDNRMSSSSSSSTGSSGSTGSSSSVSVRSGSSSAGSTGTANGSGMINSSSSSSSNNSCVTNLSSSSTSTSASGMGGMVDLFSMIRGVSARANNGLPSRANLSSDSMYQTQEGLRSLINTFRLQELQALLQFAGKGRHGRKSDLHRKACDLLRVNKPEINSKIRELASCMYNSHSMAPTVFNPSASRPTPSPSMHTTSLSTVVEPHQPRAKARRMPTEPAAMRVSGSPSTLSTRVPSSMPGTLSTVSSSDMLPTHPDVRLKKLPYYKQMATLLVPSSLQTSKSAPRFQEQRFEFTLTPFQVEQVSEFHGRGAEAKKQIQLRFSLLETSCEQDDKFPPALVVRVNNRLQPLPNPIPTNKVGVEPKRPPKPLNITPLCHLSATLKNAIEVTWCREFGVAYTVSVYLVDRQSPQDLMKELRNRGTRLPDFTKALIKEKLDDRDSDLTTTSCKVTLACPLGKMRMTYPCRAHSCDHLQCFDANFFLMMNERKPKWLCPVCNKPAFFDNLQIDGFFTEVLLSSRLPRDDNEIVLSSDGSWEPLVKKKTEEEPKKPKNDVKEPIVDIDDDTPLSEVASTSSGIGGTKSTTSGPQKRAASSVDCITLDSESSDSDTNPPPVKRKSTHSSGSSVDTIGLLTNAIDSNSGSSSPELICLDD